MFLKVIALSAILFGTDTEAAYRDNPCPSPCYCIFFLGQQGTYCNNTGITSIPNGIPLNTQLLDLSQNNIPVITAGPLKNLFNLENLVISGMGRTDLNVNLTDLQLPKLQSVDVTSNAYTSVPQTLPDYIKEIYLYNNKIPALDKDALRPYPNLSSLDMDNTGLIEIQPGAFDHSPKLSSLSIRFNNLTDDSFPPNCFAKNTALSQISMRFNRLKHVLPALPASVTYLDYVGNHIKTLQSYAFNSTKNLQTMEFWQGQVMKMYCFTSRLLKKYL